MIHDPVVELISAEIGEGAGDSGCKWGAAALREQGLAASLRARGRQLVEGDTVTSRPVHARSRLDAVETFSEQLADVVAQAVARGHQPLVVGGDHSCAVGTWSGVAQALRPRGALGLVWVDAHLDAHTPQTSDSHAPHGMPLAALLGHGSPRLTRVHGWAGKLAPHHVVVIGARSYEPAEAALLDRLGVRVMYMPEVQARGFEACFAEARTLVSAATAGWGVSFDVDGLDPQDAPGTGTPVEAGIRLRDAVAALATCHGDAGFCAFELAEYNLLRDFGGRTAQAVLELVGAALAGVPARLPLAA